MSVFYRGIFDFLGGGRLEVRGRSYRTSSGMLLVQIKGDAETYDGRIDRVVRCGEALRG